MGRHYSQAAEFFDARRYDLAERLLRLDLEADPEDAPALALLAMCLSDRQQPAAAHRAAADATRLAPELVLAHYARAVVHAAEGDRGLERAGEALRVAIQLDPTHTASLSLMAAVRLDQGFPDLALPWCDRCLQLDPQHARALCVRALVLSGLGRTEEARQLTRSALALHPADSYTHHMTGAVQWNVGDLTGAEAHFLEARRLDPACQASAESLRQVRETLIVIRTWIRVAARCRLVLPPQRPGRSARPNWMRGGLLILGFAVSGALGFGKPDLALYFLGALGALLALALGVRLASGAWVRLARLGIYSALMLLLCGSLFEVFDGPGISHRLPPRERAARVIAAQAQDSAATWLARVLMVPAAIGTSLFFLVVLHPKLCDLVTVELEDERSAALAVGLPEP